jgi:hypothetical protein
MKRLRGQKKRKKEKKKKKGGKKYLLPQLLPLSLPFY